MFSLLILEPLKMGGRVVCRVFGTVLSRRLGLAECRDCDEITTWTHVIC